MKHCATCHLEYADAKKFCGKCGKALSVVHEASGQGRTCPACRSTVRENWKFCGKCQAPLVVATPGITIPQTYHPVTNGTPTLAPQPSFSEASFIETSVASEAITCSSCGEMIEADSVCCGFCGANIGGNEAATIQSDKIVGSYGTVSEEAWLNGDFLLPEQPMVDERIEGAEATYISSELQSAELADEVQSKQSTVKVDEPDIQPSTSPTTDETSPSTDVVPEKPSDASPAIAPLIPPVFQPVNKAGRDGFDVSQLLHNKPIVLSLVALVAFASVGAFFVLKNTNSSGTPADVIQPHAAQSSDDSSPLATSSTTETTPSVTTDSVPEKMVLVSGGEFQMGRDGDDEYERPAHRVAVASFYLDK